MAFSGYIFLTILSTLILFQCYLKKFCSTFEHTIFIIRKHCTWSLLMIVTLKFMLIDRSKIKIGIIDRFSWSLGLSILIASTKHIDRSIWSFSTSFWSFSFCCLNYFYLLFDSANLIASMRNSNVPLRCWIRGYVYFYVEIKLWILADIYIYLYGIN